jgi:hypothetical protein
MDDKWLTELIQYLKDNHIEYYKTKDLELKFAQSAFYDRSIVKPELELDNITDKKAFENDLFYSAR